MFTKFDERHTVHMYSFSIAMIYKSHNNLLALNSKIYGRNIIYALCNDNVPHLYIYKLL